MRIMMREQELVVELIDSVVDIGELCKLAVQLGYEAHVEGVVSEEAKKFGAYQVRFSWPYPSPRFATGELGNLAVLLAFVNGKSGDQLLAELRRDLERRHFPMDQPIQDVMEIGGGPDHEGHNHDDD